MKIIAGRVGIDRNPGIISFLSTFIFNWWAGMSGAVSIPFAYWGLFEAPDSQKALFLGLAVLCFVTASYLVWREERQMVITLEHQAHGRVERQQTADSLAEMMRSGIELGKAAIGNDNEYADWLARFNLWHWETADIIEERMSTAEQLLFETIRPAPGSSIDLLRFH